MLLQKRFEYTNSQKDETTKVKIFLEKSKGKIDQRLNLHCRRNDKIRNFLKSVLMYSQLLNNCGTQINMQVGFFPKKYKPAMQVQITVKVG